MQEVKTIDDFKNDYERIKKIKRIFLDYAYKNNTGHLPSALSCLEILYVLYNKFAKITKDNVKAIVRDRVILSKEHARFGQACVLYEKGLLDKKVLDVYLLDGSYLGHDIYNVVGSDEIAAVDVSSGSLGHGLGVGAGMAIASKEHNIYVITGDGELQEGTCWEAIMFIGHNKLKNLTIIIDRNLQQIDNLTKEIIDTSMLSVKAIEAFGFEILECNGHNIEELTKALNYTSSKPKCIIANTIKGKEIHFMQDRVGCAFYHWINMTENDYQKAIKDL